MSSLASKRTLVNRVMQQVVHHSACPCHACQTATSVLEASNAARAIRTKGRARSYAKAVNEGSTDYAFEVSASNLRFGEGVTREVGMDFANMKARKVGVFTDANVAKLLPMKMALESLEANGIKYEVFDRCRVEPNSDSWADAIDFSRKNDFSHFLAVGGGSSMDTAKIGNLFSCYPEADMLDFVNAPVGKGIPIAKTLKPLIAIPTTAGTGSETTGTAIFDYTPLKAKTGIASRALRPTLGIVDSLNTDSCPRPVHISAGLDVLFHALESYTAIPYTERGPRPDNPIKRPAYQGRNPIGDIFSLWALKQTVKYLPRVAANQDDKLAKSEMLLAASLAGIGFGNSGVHLCHGLSYGISGLAKSVSMYNKSGYGVDYPLIPHGISVAISAGSVFEWTAPSSPDRHREAAAIFNTYKPDNVDDSRVPDEEIGQLLKDRILRFLIDLDVPRGLKGLGYKNENIPALVESAIPQHRVLSLAPNFTTGDPREHLTTILEGCMEF